MKNNYPNIKGFTKRNIERMIQFYSTYKDEDVVEYSVSKNMSQTMISKYKLKLIDKKLSETKLKEMKNLIDNDDK